MTWFKRILEEIIKQIDNGEFEDLTPNDLEQISTIIHRPETVGREAAAKFLGLSLNRFHELRDAGEIPEPRKRKGFKEKEYYMSDLCACKECLKLKYKQIR